MKLQTKQYAVCLAKKKVLADPLLVFGEGLAHHVG